MISESSVNLFLLFRDLDSSGWLFGISLRQLILAITVTVLMSVKHSGLCPNPI